MSAPVNESVNKFLAAFSPEVRDLALKVRDLVFEVKPDAIEGVDPSSKIIGFGYGTKYKDLIGAIALQKSYVNLMFSKGTQLPDPKGLLEGTGKSARHIKIRTADDLKNPAVKKLLKEAISAMKR